MGNAILIIFWNGFYRHRIGDNILNNKSHRRQNDTHHIPAFYWQNAGHAGGMCDQAMHDQEAGGDHPSPKKHHVILMFPDQVNKMAKRHFQRPWQTRPKPKAGQKTSG